jgi:lysophospholipase L1-like esterase
MSQVTRRDVRIVILGDAIISSAGDPKGMGWVGRVSSKTPSNFPRIDIFALPAPDETTSMLAERWQAEVQRRFSAETENKLVIALSNNDPAAGISISRSRLNIATIVDEAKRSGIESFLIGPTPHRNKELNSEVEHLASGFEDVADRRGVPFVDCFRPLVEHEGWNLEIETSENGLPGQVGHGLIAWLVLNRGWYEWLDIPTPE